MRTARRKLIPSLLALAVSGAVSAPVSAEGPSDWGVSGSNTLRIESYGVDGDPTQSPYAFTGGQAYNEFYLNLARRVSPHEQWRAQIIGVVNDSEYRNAQHNGLIPERLNLFYENGKNKIPFRVDTGDFYGYFSFRTLQESMKGVQLELQPLSKTPGRRHSVLLVTGTNDSDWRDLDAGEDYSNAVSWVVEDQKYGRLGVNLVQNSRDATVALPERDQIVLSVSAAKDFISKNRRLALEGEIGFFDGDHDGIGGASGQNKSDEAFYIQLSGQEARSPLSYRFRYEEYGQDYRPRGATAIQSDRQSAEAHVGWRFNSGMNLRGRIQQYEERRDTANPVDSAIYGVKLSGPLFVDGLTGDLDVFAYSIDDATGTQDQSTDTIKLNLNKALPRAWNGHAEFFWQDLDDETAANRDSETVQLGVGATHELKFSGLTGSITPGLLYRSVDNGASASDDWSPSLQMSLNNGPHFMGFSYGYLTQDFDATGEVSTHNVALRYRFNLNSANVVGLEANWYDRSADTALDTEAYRISAYWTYRFDKPAGSRIKVQKAAALNSGQAYAAAFVSNAGLLAQLVPGVDMAHTKPRLEKETGLTAPAWAPGSLVYEARLIPDIDQRQRLVLTHGADTLRSSALVIDFNNANNARETNEIFERVREQLLRQYGKPIYSYEKGEFTNRLVASVNMGRFVRIIEWETDSGVLRYGIPRRLDGKVRIEIQHTAQQLALRNPEWSLTQVR